MARTGQSVLQVPRSDAPCAAGDGGHREEDHAETRRDRLLSREEREGGG